MPPPAGESHAYRRDSLTLRDLLGRIPAPLGYLLTLLGIAAAYVLFAKIGFSLAFETRQVTAVWPPAGIAVAVLLLGGYRMWPGIWLGAFVSNALTGETALTAAGIAVGNALGPLFGTYLLRRFTNFDKALERLSDVIGFVLLAGLLAMTVTATNGVLQLVLAGIVAWHDYPSVWLLWWTGDTMGVLIVAPLILTWLAGERRIQQAAGRFFEGALLAITLIVATWISFTSRPPLAYPIYPFVIWAAIRFRQRATTLAIATIAGIAIWGTTHGRGPFSITSTDQRLLFLVTFLGVLSVTGLVLCALITERRVADDDVRRAQDELRVRETELQVALQQSTRVVETLRAAFLPEKLPQRADVRIDALYMTAGHEDLIGGDWYDAFELPDGRMVVSIGDVIGHGLDAAVTAGRIRQAIFATALDALDPATILSKVNRALQVQTSTVATALVAMFDSDLTTMRYASAGHPPPMLAGPTSPARALAYGGTPLGVGATLELVNESVALQRDEVLLFYTDGITEFRRDIDGTEKELLAALSAVARDGSARPAATIQRAVMDAQEPSDDVVLLVLQLLPLEAGIAPEGHAAFTQTWSFQSSDGYAARASRHELIRFMRRFGVSEDDLFQAELVLGEMLANTVQHAPGPVTLEIDWSADRPVVSVCDTGPGQFHLAKNLPQDTLSDCGRGLFLISTLAEDVRVEPAADCGTRVSIVLPLSRSGALKRETA
jgi:integral membrane sensor domain MASE1/serine phosphatase RsbU (regulator of sigma subunit)/anti-sigma regulatory factor (Ser/Thr protein kinase)